MKKEKLHVHVHAECTKMTGIIIRTLYMYMNVYKHVHVHCSLNNDILYMYKDTTILHSDKQK